MANIENALKQFEKVMREQLERVERMKNAEEQPDYQNLDKIIIGVCGGDGIGPVIKKSQLVFWSFCSKIR